MTTVSSVAWTGRSGGSGSARLPSRSRAATSDDARSWTMTRSPVTQDCARPERRNARSGEPPDEQVAGVAEQVGPEPGHEAVGQSTPCACGDGHENPPSAWTTLPLSTAPSREQQKAIAAATSSGSRTRRSSWRAEERLGVRKAVEVGSGLEHRRTRGARRDGGGGHAGADQVGGQPLHETDDSVLGDVVRREAEHAVVPGSRGDGDETAAARVRSRRASPARRRPRCSRLRGCRRRRARRARRDLSPTAGGRLR